MTIGLIMTLKSLRFWRDKNIKFRYSPLDLVAFLFSLAPNGLMIGNLKLNHAETGIIVAYAIAGLVLQTVAAGNGLVYAFASRTSSDSEWYSARCVVVFSLCGYVPIGLAGIMATFPII